MGNQTGMTNAQKAEGMATTTSEWYWNAAPDPWLQSENEEWKRYSEIETEVIEEGFQEQKICVDLERYIIDLRHHIQISKTDPTKQRPIKRVVVTQQQQCLRERFSTHQKLTDASLRDLNLPEDLSNIPRKKSFTENGSSFPPFVENWITKYPDLTLSEKVEQAVQGIITEGENLGESFNAKRLAKKLEKCVHEGQAEICKRCLRLYTQETFLYKLLNNTLRDNDMDKIDTLGAFCYLLFYCAATEQLTVYHYKGLVYRGINLELSEIEAYENAIGTGYKCWLGFSSTSKSREKAEKFGNTLFIINIKYSIDSLDISSLSAYPQEQEVLLSASQLFKVDKVEYNTNNKKYEINISIWWTIA